MLLWLWLAAASPIQPLAQELPYASSEALKRQNKTKQNKTKQKNFVRITFIMNRQGGPTLQHRELYAVS